MPTRVLVLGAGGREHAIAWKLASEPGINAVFVAPGNAGMTDLARVSILPDVDPLDGPMVVAAARSVTAELVVIGPEAPLAVGVADALRQAGFPVFGPGRAAARIESSKAFCHEVATAGGVRMPRFEAFREPTAAVEFARRLAASGGGVVVKADGLAAGKGVTVCDDADEAEAAIRSLARDPERDDSSDAPFVVVEERLRGPEASLIALTDGRDVLALPLARDHKRLLDDDHGPNTGGMGAYSPLPDLAADEIGALLDAFHRPILAELSRRGVPFIGALYAGLILTGEGPVLLECNARFGDPETQVLMPRLASPIGPLLLAAARGSLRSAAISAGIVGSVMPTLPGAAVAIVLAAAGYPESPRRGDSITGLDAGAAGDLIFHAGASRDEEGVYRTSGGRVLAVVGRGPTLDEAADRADAAAGRIAFDGMQRRRDIGRRPELTGSGPLIGSPRDVIRPMTGSAR